MAVTTQKSTEYTNATATPPTNNDTTDLHGRVRIASFVHDQSGAGDATSSVALFKLPAGEVRLSMEDVWMYVNWTTASATLDLGWDAYTGQDGTAVAADADGLVDGVSVETAGVLSGANEDLVAAAGAGWTAANGYSKVFASKNGVVIRATSTDTAIADGDDLVGRMKYVVD